MGLLKFFEGLLGPVKAKAGGGHHGKPYGKQEEFHNI
jgi:hypothetical protein